MSMDILQAAFRNHVERMEYLANECELEFDGGEEEQRLFVNDSLRIDVFAPAMGRKKYEEMEKDLDEYAIKRDKYHVYAWNDCSGFDYWNNESEMNYIQITVWIENDVLSKEERDQLVEDVDDLHNHFSKYNNIEDWCNAQEQIEANRMKHNQILVRSGYEKRT